jgi:hypothetical protein
MLLLLDPAVSICCYSAFMSFLGSPVVQTDVQSGKVSRIGIRPTAILTTQSYGDLLAKVHGAACTLVGVA